VNETASALVDCHDCSGSAPYLSSDGQDVRMPRAEGSAGAAPAAAGEGTQSDTSQLTDTAH
jgi:hypothetical protein